ncbi:hypothetical protein PSA7680_02427 [Pseudoruegeria aquimaris]|uniref:Holin-like protein n=1 Tax=Pseudoruegeria aquimaris TaxID=393663 RepID=A0A1Y5SSJ9_9RHOB|nr:CidA/LrgA family protein [Pseudoruegeria aquimaris]SLN47336.1 hypothetical protein PSA7680_02427 [Pseudoruegeria aquimaris]
MLAYLTLIFTCQFLGELLMRSLGLPVPGPVAGMVMLFAFLMWRGAVPEGLDVAARGLLQNLSLLFVPAGAGVVLHLRLLGEGLVPVTVSLVISIARHKVCAIQTQGLHTPGAPI